MAGTAGRRQSRGACASQRSRLELHVDGLHEPVAELGAIPSTGTVEHSYDNSMAEAVNALYKVNQLAARTLCSVEQAEFATLEVRVVVEQRTLAWGTRYVHRQKWKCVLR